MRGWIALDRGIVLHWVWYEARALKWWLDLVIHAAWKDCEVRYLGQRLSLKRGQLAASMRRLARRWDAGDVRTAKKCLEDFELDNMITISYVGDIMVITIVNYDKYQLDKARIENYLDEDEIDDEGDDGNVNNQDGMHHGIRHQFHQEKQGNNIKNNNNSHTNALTRENSFFEKLKRSDVFTRETMEQLDITRQELNKQLREFYKEMLIKSFEHKNFNDYKRHFYDWLKIKKQNEERSKGKPRTRRSGDTADDKYAARRGTDVSAKKSDDFGGTF